MSSERLIFWVIALRQTAALPAPTMVETSSKKFHDLNRNVQMHCSKPSLRKWEPRRHADPTTKASASSLEPGKYRLNFSILQGVIFV